MLDGFRAVERVHDIGNQGEGQQPASSLDGRYALIAEGEYRTLTGRVFDPLTLRNIPGGLGGYSQARVTVQAASPRASTLAESVIRAHETLGFMCVLLEHEGWRSGMGGRLRGEDEKFMKEG